MLPHCAGTMGHVKPSMPDLGVICHPYVSICYASTCYDQPLCQI